MVTVRVDDSCVLDLRVNLAHVLQAPEPSADRLGHRHGLARKLRIKLFVLDGEEDGNEREANAMLVVLGLSRQACILLFIQLLHQVVYAVQVASVALV